MSDMSKSLRWEPRASEEDVAGSVGEKRVVKSLVSEKAWDQGVEETSKQLTGRGNED